MGKQDVELYKPDVYNKRSSIWGKYHALEAKQKSCRQKHGGLVPGISSEEGQLIGNQKC